MMALRAALMALILAGIPYSLRFAAAEDHVMYNANPSIISLIVAPEDFAGMTIYTSGFARAEHEDYRIYLSKEDAKRGIVENSVRYEPHGSSIPMGEIRKLDSKYVQIGGIIELVPNVDESGRDVAVITQLKLFRPL